MPNIASETTNNSVNNSKLSNLLKLISSVLLLLAVFAILDKPSERIGRILLRNNYDLTQTDFPLSFDGIPMQWSCSQWENIGYLKTNVIAPPVFNLNFSGHKLMINETLFSNGICVRSPSQLAFSLQKKTKRFSCLAGLDNDSERSVSDGVFLHVLADGHEIYKSEKVNIDSNPIAIDLPVANVNQLVLYVEVKALEDVGNNVDWVDLKFNP